MTKHYQDLNHHINVCSDQLLTYWQASFMNSIRLSATLPKKTVPGTYTVKLVLFSDNFFSIGTACSSTLKFSFKYCSVFFCVAVKFRYNVWNPTKLGYVCVPSGRKCVENPSAQRYGIIIGVLFPDLHG